MRETQGNSEIPSSSVISLKVMSPTDCLLAHSSNHLLGLCLSKGRNRPQAALMTELLIPHAKEHHFYSVGFFGHLSVINCCGYWWTLEIGQTGIKWGPSCQNHNIPSNFPSFSIPLQLFFSHHQYIYIYSVMFTCSVFFHRIIKRKMKERSFLFPCFIN